MKNTFKYHILLCTLLFVNMCCVRNNVVETDVEGGTWTIVDASLGGKCVDKDNKPLDSALVVITYDSVSTDSTYSDDTGFFLFESFDIDTGNGTEVTIDARFVDGLLTLSSHRKLFLTTLDTMVTCTLLTPGSVSGNVRKCGEKNHLGIQVYIPNSSYNSMTDSGGNFFIDWVSPGIYTVIFDAFGYVQKEKSYIQVQAGLITPIADTIILNPDYQQGPRPPCDVSATVDSSGKYVSVNWSGSPCMLDSVEYIIHRRIDGSWQSPEPVGAVKDTFYIDSTVDTTEIMTYTYHVKARDTNCNLSVFSPPATVRIIPSALQPLLEIDTDVLEFIDDMKKYFTLSNKSIDTNGIDLQWEITVIDTDWITVKPQSGMNTANIAVSVDREKITLGTQDTGILHIVSNGGSTEVTVIAANRSAKERLTVDTDSLDFGGDKTSQTIGVANLGAETMNCTIRTDEDWLSCKPQSEIQLNPGDSQFITVSIDRKVARFGTSTGLVKIRSVDGEDSVSIHIGILRRFSLDEIEFDYVNVLGTVYDSGSNSYPALGDLDNDGDLDIVTGSTNGLHGYCNTGNKRNFVFQAEPGNYALDSISVTSSTPALVDIDADGDLDLFIGSTSGIFAYKNIGSKEYPQWSEISEFASDFGNFDAGITLSFSDLDNDGDFDCIIGQHSNSMVTGFRNIGTSQRPKWSQEPSYTFGIDPGQENASVAISDFDEDNDFDMIFIYGGQHGIPVTEWHKALFYENIGTSSVVQWRYVKEYNSTERTLAYKWCAIALGDLDDDGDDDMILGCQDGRLYYYVNLKYYPD